MAISAAISIIIAMTYIFSSSNNRIGGVVVSVFAPGAVDRGFEPWSGPTKQK